MKADFRKNPIINECLFNSRLKASMVMLAKKETVRLVDSIGDILQSNVTIFNPFEAKIKQDNTSVMRCAIWYHLYNSKSVKHTHGGMLLLVKMQASTCNFTKSNSPLWVFLTFFKLHKRYQIAQRITCHNFQVTYQTENEKLRLPEMHVRYYYVTYRFQSESTLYSCLNVKELLARNRRHI